MLGRMMLIFEKDSPHPLQVSLHPVCVVARQRARQSDIVPCAAGFPDSLHRGSQPAVAQQLAASTAFSEVPQNPVTLVCHTLQDAAPGQQAGGGAAAGRVDTGGAGRGGGVSHGAHAAEGTSTQTFSATGLCILAPCSTLLQRSGSQPRGRKCTGSQLMVDKQFLLEHIIVHFACLSLCHSQRSCSWGGAASQT